MSAAISNTNSLQISQESAAQALVGSAAVIACEWDDGSKENIATGYVIYQMMRKCFPKLQLVFSYVNYVNADGSEVSAWERSMGKSSLKNLTEQDEKDWEVTKIQDVYARIEKEEFRFIVLTSAMNDTHTPKQILDSGVSIIKLQDYCKPPKLDFTEPPVYTLGFAKHEKGVAFPCDLYEHPSNRKQILDEICKSCKTSGFEPMTKDVANIVFDYFGDAGVSTAFRLHYFRKLPRALGQLILDPQYEADAIDRFVSNSRLYYGYAIRSSSVHAYLSAICRLPNDTANITVWILQEYSKLIKGTGDKTFTQMLESEKMTYAQANFNHIEIYLQQNQRPQQIPLNGSGKRRLRIIFQPLPPKQADELAKASEQETLATEDSSFLKAWALNKITFYEDNRRNSEFINSFIRLTSQKNPAISESLTKGLPESFLKMKGDPKLNTAWYEIVKEIADKHSIEQFLPEIILDEVDLFENLDPALDPVLSDDIEDLHTGDDKFHCNIPLRIRSIGRYVLRYDAEYFQSQISNGSKKPPRIILRDVELFKNLKDFIKLSSPPNSTDSSIHYKLLNNYFFQHLLPNRDIYSYDSKNVKLIALFFSTISANKELNNLWEKIVREMECNHSVVQVHPDVVLKELKLIEDSRKRVDRLEKHKRKLPS